MNKLQILGKQEFMGKEIPVVEGGFGEGQKVILAKTIAEIHDTRLDKVNELINNHIDEFEVGIDLLNLMENEESLNLAKGLGFISNNRQKNCYLLSEQGYMLLVGFMNTDKAKEIRKQLRREYFTMRKVINSLEQKKANLLLDIYNGGESGVLASKQLVELEVEEAKKPLLPKANWFDEFMGSEGLYNSTQIAKVLHISSARKLNQILYDKGIIYKKGVNWLPYATTDDTWYKMVVGGSEYYSYSQLKFTPKGLYGISELLDIELKEEDIKLA